MKRFFSLGLLLVTVGAVLAAEKVTENEINVALSKWGATATASSVFGEFCGPEKAINGKWANRDSDKWASAHNKTPHWLLIDLGDKYETTRIVVRHEGIFAEGEVYNTSDYRLQIADATNGPWKDVIDPVRGNTQDVTTHEFAPVQTRYVRLLIEKAEQQGNACARIYAVEVYTPKNKLHKSFFGLDFSSRAFRRNYGRLETLARVEYIVPGDSAVDVRRFFITSADTEIELVGNEPQVWLPVSGGPQDFVLLAETNAGKAELAKSRVITPSPNYFFDGGTVHIMSSSHQDIAWMDSPQFCRKWRDQYNVTAALEMMEKDENYRFTVESMMYLMDELEDHPERREKIHKLTKEGRLEWGATYTQPYESFLSGEQMIRGMYLGRKWLHQTFPDCDALVAWNPDVPGRAMQMPQILSKAGIPYLIFSRHDKGLYNWLSPDGSGITAYSSGHYGNDHFLLFSKEPDKAVAQLNKQLEAEQAYYKAHQIEPQYALLNSIDFSKPADFEAIIKAFESGGDDDIISPPQVKYASSAEYFKQVTKGNPEFKTIVGERPNVWLYIHGPGHHWAATASRNAGILLPAAETFAVIDCLLDDSFRNYPADEFFEAWKAACFPDHGWGGNKGDITDALFREKLESARVKGQQILDRSLHKIASRVKTDSTEGKPLVVFNTLSWKRSGVVRKEISGLAEEIHITDSRGQIVPHQFLPCTEYGKREILFIAKDVPATGYKTFYVVPGKKESQARKNPSGSSGDTVLENEFYKVNLAAGGVEGIFDKQLKKEILRPGKFLGGEVFTMKSVGNGAGEFSRVQQPTMEGFDRISCHKPKWTLNESETGSVQTVFCLSQKLEHCTVQQKITLFNDIKKIDFEVSLLGWDGTKSREFRMALPVNADDAKIAYEVAMGVLEVGKDEIEGAAGGQVYGGLSYGQDCRETRPREVQNFITASNDQFGITMSSSVAVCDWVDPTSEPVDYPILQPILLASRKSCHYLGPWYLQAGDHHYRFSVLSHKADWKNGYRFGIESNTPLQVVTGATTASDAALPTENSFFSVSADNVIISTIKKCEDDDSVVVRLYDIEGKDSDVALNTFFGIDRAEHTNIIEEEGKKIPSQDDCLELKVGHHSIETLKIFPEQQ